MQASGEIQFYVDEEEGLFVSQEVQPNGTSVNANGTYHSDQENHDTNGDLVMDDGPREFLTAPSLPPHRAAMPGSFPNSGFEAAGPPPPPLAPVSPSVVELDEVKREEEDEESNYSALYDDIDEEERKERDPNAYYPKNKFPPARMVTRTVQELYDLLEEDVIDLNAEYQREVVWTEDRQSGLVTTLMEGYYVPPVLFNMKLNPDTSSSSKIHVCVDGKQRLTSIRAFMKGDIPCRDDQDQKWYFKPKATGRAGRRVLPEEARRHFSRRSLLCYEIENLERSQEEDLFARVQRGVSLNEPEKLRASQGPWQALATQFESDFESFIKRSSSRRSHGWGNILGCFSQIMECEHPASPDGVPRLKATNSSVKKLLESPGLLTPATRAQFTRVFTTLVALDQMDRFLFGVMSHGTKTFAPIEMVGVAVLVALHGEKRSLEMLKGDIRAFRNDIRQGRVDLRMNKNTWDAVWEWIETVESRRGATDGTTTSQVPKEESDSDSSFSGSSSESSSESESEDGDDGADGRQGRKKPVQTKQQSQQGQQQQRPTVRTSTQQAAPASSAQPTIGLSAQQRGALMRKRKLAEATASATATTAAQQNAPNKRVRVQTNTGESSTTAGRMEGVQRNLTITARRLAAGAATQTIPKRVKTTGTATASAAAREPIMAATTTTVRGGQRTGPRNGMTTMPLTAPMAPSMAPLVPPNPFTLSPPRAPAATNTRPTLTRPPVPTTAASGRTGTTSTQQCKRAAPDNSAQDAALQSVQEDGEDIKMEGLGD